VRAARVVEFLKTGPASVRLSAYEVCGLRSVYNQEAVNDASPVCRQFSEADRSRPQGRPHLGRFAGS
jgi:hypothetical protein